MPLIGRGLDRVAAVLAAVMVLLLLATVLAGVVTRAMNEPLDWTDEASRMLMLWLACAGWVLATRRGLHVRIRSFQDRLPPVLRRGVEGVIQLGLVGLGVAVAAYGAGLVRRNWDLEATTMPVSIAWLYVPLVPAGLVTAGQAVHDLFAGVRAP